MNIRIKPSTASGTIDAPRSKSSMQRSCAAALLYKGKTTIHNPGKSNDDLAALDVIEKLGAKVIENTDRFITIESQGIKPIENEIKCGESGLGIRMFTPIAALSEKPLTISGSGSLVTRPMNFFDEIFPRLGIQIKSNNGKLPLQIQGPLIPQNIEVDGSLSSQFLTGLLMSFGSVSIDEPVTISVRNLKSKPYIDLTLKVMEDFAMNVPAHDDYRSFTFSPFNQASSSSPINYIVEGDWSGAAFLLVAGAICGEITIEGLDVFSTQADKEILQALMAADCSLSIHKKQIKVSSTTLKAFKFNATDCPDLFPPLVALAAYCKGTTVIKGTSRLQHKESNRALTLQQEFAKLGVEIMLKDDEMLVKGADVLRSASVHSNHDHRIAMACAVAALKADGEVTIQQAEAVDKSYPKFYEDLQQLGVAVFK